METKLAIYHIKNEILYAVYKKNLTVSLEDAQEMVADRIAIQNGKEYPVILHLNGITKSSKAARHYMATEGVKGISLCAIIPKDYTDKTTIKFFFSIEKPAILHKEFADEAEAIQWIYANKK